MILNSPEVPVFTPDDFERQDNVIPLFGVEEDEELLRKRDELVLARERSQALMQRRFMLYGLLGVVTGAAVTGGMTALALRSYRRTDSVAGPAIYSGLGSLAMGGTMIFLLSRVVGGKNIDPRLAAVAAGATMAH